MKVESTDHRARELLDEAIRANQFSPEDGGLLTELVYGCLRRRGSLDFYLAGISHRPLKDLSPWVRNLLRIALYQVRYLDRVPNAAAVDTAVEISKAHGHEGVVKFVNGVLREFCRQVEDDKVPGLPDDPVRALAVRHSAPVWMSQRLLDRYGYDRAESFLDASNQSPPLTLRANRLRSSRDALAGKLLQAGLKVEACRFSPDGLRVSSGGDVRRLPGYQQGEFVVQDESSQMVALLADVKPGWKVADVCAAPGGKSTHLASLVGSEGLVWAFDRKGNGLDKLHATAKRLGLRQIRHEVRDALHPREDLLGSMDAVLVDAPCSGLGVLRRRVESRWQLQPDSAARQVDRQKKILEASAAYLKPGGVLIYATCTIEEEENENVVMEFLEKHSDFRFERASKFLPPELVTRDGFYRAWPGEEQMDGFFAARMVKGEAP